MRTVNVILAAGFGTRMKSDLPKVMHPLLGRPLIEWSVQVAETVSELSPVVVVGHGQDLVKDALADRVEYVVQTELLGTGHAVQQTEPLLAGQADVVLVTYGDMPLLAADTLAQLLAMFQGERRKGTNLAIAMLTVVRDDPQGFGRIVRNNQGEIQAIVEEVDCTSEQKQIRELNPGIYCFDAEWLWNNLAHMPLSPKGEYYLTDMVGIAVKQGRSVEAMPAPAEEVDGINTRVHLAHAGDVLGRRILEQHMLAGVTIVDPKTTYIDGTVQIGQDTTILPGCLLQGKTAIGSHSTVGPYSQLVDSKVGNRCRISFSVLEQAQMEDDCEIGPYGHLRKGAHLAHGVYMGNYGEVKNSYLGPGVKMGHFSYVGDAQVESNVNIGAGTITCNYDGEKKHRTVIGKDAFIGSDTLLVAPVEIGDGARTGAGSVVTRDVPPNSLAYGVPARSAARSTRKGPATDG